MPAGHPGAFERSRGHGARRRGPGRRGLPPFRGGGLPLLFAREGAPGHRTSLAPACRRLVGWITA